MSEIRVQTIRTVIDVEVRERTPRNPSQPYPDTTAEEHGYEQGLFTMLEADAELYAEFIKIQAIVSLQGLGSNNMISGLAQIRDAHTASMQVIQRRLPHFEPQHRRIWLRPLTRAGSWTVATASTTGWKWNRSTQSRPPRGFDRRLPVLAVGAYGGRTKVVHPLLWRCIGSETNERPMECRALYS